MYSRQRRVVSQDLSHSFYPGDQYFFGDVAIEEACEFLVEPDEFCFSSALAGHPHLKHGGLQGVEQDVGAGLAGVGDDGYLEVGTEGFDI